MTTFGQNESKPPAQAYSVESGLSITGGESQPIPILPVDKPKEWWVKRAREEGDALIAAGTPEPASKLEVDQQLGRLSDYLHSQYVERRNMGDDSAGFFDEWEIALVRLRAALDKAQRERDEANTRLARHHSLGDTGVVKGLHWECSKCTEMLSKPTPPGPVDPPRPIGLSKDVA
jgi:hypothetical protein